ncbi:MAG: phosphodiester glycosidase family protein [Clostridia bacterium]|nr:phosphodiester glycosidase family protein [Clostridia bacterium]
MRKLIAILLLITMVLPAALCEEAVEAQTIIEPLSSELDSGAHVANPDNYIEADPDNGVLAGYSDESITITLEQITEDGVLYNVARVKIADPSQLRTGLDDPKKGKKNNYVHNIAGKYNAILAISGDFFSKNSSGYVVRMGEVFRKKLYANRDMLLIDSNGDFHIIYRSNAEDLEALLAREDVTFPNVFNFGPALVAEGVALEMPEYYLAKNTFNVTRPEPRCAIGQIGELEYLLVVADGRNGESEGATGEQLAQFMAAQGCITAYNLDGGDTALMWFKDDYYSRKTKRSQSDIIYFGTAINYGLDATED